jgi:hypothetical protein
MRCAPIPVDVACLLVREDLVGLLVYAQVDTEGCPPLVVTLVNCRALLLTW